MQIGMMAACSEYFGRKPGQGFKEFKEEVDQLTDKDRADLAPLLAAALGKEVTSARVAPAPLVALSSGPLRRAPLEARPHQPGDHDAAGTAFGSSH